MKSMTTKKGVNLMKQLAKHKLHKILGWIAIITASILAVLTIIVSIVNPIETNAVFDSEKSETAETQEELNMQMEQIKQESANATTEEVTEESEEVTTEEVVSEAKTSEEQTVEYEWHFYNSELQNDGDAKNDYNFGPNPIYENLSLEKVKEAIKGKSPNASIKVSDIISAADAEAINADFKARRREDPALGTTSMAWFDSIMGTRYLGVFYDECDHEWDATMNMAKEKFIADQEYYYNTLDAFEAMLDSAEIEIRYVKSGLTDQMYMNPYTVDNIPDIIVMDTTNHDGWFIVYKPTIKETTTKEIMYRIDCGYQPTNVAKTMNIRSRPNPNNGGGSTTKKTQAQQTQTQQTQQQTTTTNTNNGGGSSTTGGSDPGDKNKPKQDPYNKDKTQGSQVLPNDVTGPGEDTNTGKGSQYSSKDKIGNSNDLTYQEYTDVIKDLEDANKSREAGDPNTPTSQAPADTTVHSNAENGTGYGGIDAPTNVSDSSVSNDSPGVHWDEPSD